VQSDLRVVPAAANGPDRAAKDRRGFVLRDSLVVQQIEHFSLSIRQCLNSLMKLGPFREIAWLGLQGVKTAARLIRRLVVGVEVSADAVWTKVLSSKVDELTADL